MCDKALLTQTCRIFVSLLVCSVCHETVCTRPCHTAYNSCGRLHHVSHPVYFVATATKLIRCHISRLVGHQAPQAQIVVACDRRSQRALEDRRVVRADVEAKIRVRPTPSQRPDVFIVNAESVSANVVEGPAVEWRKLSIRHSRWQESAVEWRKLFNC